MTSDTATETKFVPDPTPTDLRAEITALQTTLASLSPPLATLSETLSTSATTTFATSTSTLNSAVLSTKSLVTFLHSHPPESTDALLYGTLQSHLGALFGSFAITEATALSCAASLEPLLSDLSTFENFSVSPLQSVLETLQTRAETEKVTLITRLDELKLQTRSVEEELSKKSIERTESEQQMKELAQSVESVSREIETLEAEKASLERKLHRQRERRRTQSSAAAAGNFFSVFAPVFVPLTVAGGAPTLLAKDKLHTLTSTIENLRHQLTGLSPSSITDVHASLTDACSRLHAVHTNMAASLTTLSADLEYTDASCDMLVGIENEMEGVLRKVGDLRDEVGRGKRRLEEMAKKAQGCKWEVAQAIVTTGRMGLEEARGYVVAPVRTICRVLQGVEGVAEVEEVVEAVVRGEWRGGEEEEVISEKVLVEME